MKSRARKSSLTSAGSILNQSDGPGFGSTTMTGPKLTGNRCHCTACREYFNSDSTFQRHRKGGYETATSRRCLAPANLIARGWSKNAAGLWIQRARETATTRVERARVPLPARVVPAPIAEHVFVDVSP